MQQGSRPARPLPTPGPLQFQGEWYVLGLAGNTYMVADRSLLSPFTATFTLNKNSHLEVAYAMVRPWGHKRVRQDLND